MTSHRKTYTNDFPRNGFFTRLPRGLLAACKAEWTSGNRQPNGLSEIAHEWSKILHGLEKNLREWVNDLFSLLWFHGLTQTAFEKLQSFGPNLTLKTKSAKLLRRTETPQRVTNETQILASWLRTTKRFRKLNSLSTSIFGCPHNFTFVEVRKGRQWKICCQPYNSCESILFTR